MLRFLAEACEADVNAVSYGGLNGYQLALLNGRLDVAELLRQLGAGAGPLPDSDMDTSSESDSEVSRRRSSARAARGGSRARRGRKIVVRTELRGAFFVCILTLS